MEIRPRRLRKTAVLREMVAETRLSADMFIYPYFVTHGKGIKEEIGAMPGIYHFSPDSLIKDVEEVMQLGINKILLFGVGEKKSPDGSTSFREENVVSTTVKALKEKFGNDLFIVTDVCICAYTDHGHCGIIHDDYVVNDESLEVLAKMALSHTQAGADMVAPSDMMDGRIAAIRAMLDANGLVDTPIMSYAVKFASAYYGPFREAADSAPSFGNRKTYQMDVRNRREAVKEAELDEFEGADIIMVKPALAYLDIIKGVKEQTNLPVACYNVSGEYSMVKAAAKAGLVDEEKLILENLYAFVRAGADIIITYHAREALEKKLI